MNPFRTKPIYTIHENVQLCPVYIYISLSLYIYIYISPLETKSHRKNNKSKECNITQKCQKDKNQASTYCFCNRRIRSNLSLWPFYCLRNFLWQAKSFQVSPFIALHLPLIYKVVSFAYIFFSPVFGIGKRKASRYLKMDSKWQLWNASDFLHILN
jgi:hypothetical protein